MKFFGKMIGVFDRILEVLGITVGTMIILIMLVICLNVIMKYAFNQPIMGVEEITEQLLLFITFLGTAWLLKREGHVSVDFVLERLGPKSRLFLGMLSSLVGVFICAALTWYGSKVTWINFRTHSYFSTLLELPKGPIYAVIPIGSFLLFLQFVRMALQNMKKFGETRERA